MSKQVLPPPSAETVLDHLCGTCQSVFDSEVIELLFERPKDTYHIRRHMLCGDLPISARSCHLCSWILASCVRVETFTEWCDADGNDVGTENLIVSTFSSEDMFSGNYEKERIQLKIDQTWYGIRLDVSSYPKSTIYLSGTILLSQIVRVLR